MSSFYPRAFSGFSYKKDCPLSSSSTHIRLVHVEPSEDFTSPLQCNIEVVELARLSAYVALSYTWGQGSPNYPLAVVGVGEVKITSSLEICLRHLRHRTDRHTLWIDQICIDQSDASEKMAQIPLMRDIYRNAEKVIAWIGPAEHGSDQLIEAWEQAGNDFLALGIANLPTEALSPILRGVETNDPTTVAFIGIAKKINAALRDSIEDMRLFYQRAWFRRTWVVQEVALGKQVLLQCGYKTVDTERLRWGMIIYHGSWALVEVAELSPTFRQANQDLQAAEPLNQLIGIRNKTQRHLQNPTGQGNRRSGLLEYLKTLSVSWSMEATDPRDKIYGMLALPDDVGNLGIEPDYSLTVNQVYTKVARAIAHYGNGKGGPTIEFLNFCRHTGGTIPEHLPSWVPDWRINVGKSFANAFRVDDAGPLFHAGGGETVSPVLLPTDSMDHDILGLEGYWVDEIEEVGTPWLGPPAERDFAREGLSGYALTEARARDFRKIYGAYLSFITEVQRFCDKALAKHCKSDTDLKDTISSLEEAFWRIPSGDLADLQANFATRATHDWKKFYDVFQEFCQYMAETNESRFINYWQPRFAQRSAAENREAAYLTERYKIRTADMENMKPFVTKTGYVGLGPLSATENDEVVVFIGAQTPFVVRRADAKQYRLIGEAYCHLIMDGEMLLRGTKTKIYLV